jgi:hypothetical protein
VGLDGTDKEQALGCSGGPLEGWGFPAHADQINVTAIIATVPDPVHGHLALAFDRAVEEILQAAADHSYVSSYYWLPWKTRTAALKAAENEGDAEPGHDSERERQPGLIILKYVPTEKDAAAPSNSFYRVVYLFLVAETPTEGVDGSQLQHAFHYEAQLRSALGSGFSTGINGRVAIVGPLYSGSAASLRAGIEAALRHHSLPATEFEVTAATSTSLANNQMVAMYPAPDVSSVPSYIDYLSFESDGEYSTNRFLSLLKASGYELAEAAKLIEDNTALGTVSSRMAPPTEEGGDAEGRRQRAKARASPTPHATEEGGDGVLVIRFPREISLLRNAQVTGDQSGNEAGPPGAIPSPYLRFSLKDSSAQDAVPQFSRESTPLSQEAQLMAIARRLHRSRSKFIAISGSNVLDQLFLAQFLHRACPGARLVFFGADQLLVREVDSVPFVGSLTVTPYPLISLGTGRARRAHPNSPSEAFYNAVSYTFWHNRLNGIESPEGIFADYRSPLVPTVQQPALWATAIGRDGYYPLAVLSPCATKSDRQMPAIDPFGRVGKESCEAQPIPWTKGHIYPSLLWYVACAVIALLCLSHTAMLLVADYRSPFTRDLAIRDNDQPHRRSMHVHVATAMLFSMAFVISFPVISLSLRLDVSLASKLLGGATLGVGLAAVFASVRKTRGYRYGRLGASVYPWFNLLACVTLLLVPGLWAYLCLTNSAGPSAPGGLNLVGLCFSYRCIHPGSGVSPVVPVLLLLFSWYLWGVFQTRRLRYSGDGRPRLPKGLEDKHKADGNSLGVSFVSDDDLNDCQTPQDCWLYENITCLLITREVLCRFWKFRGGRRAHRHSARQDDGTRRGHGICVPVDIVLVLVYLGLLVWFCWLTPIHSLDDFLWKARWYRPKPYEFLVGGLFFPLIVICLTGWLRMILVWGALKRGLLERLENQPIRFAFTRLRAMGWMKMLRQAGLQEHWRNRSLESMRHLLHQPDLRESMSEPQWLQLQTAKSDLEAAVTQLLPPRGGLPDALQPEQLPYEIMNKIEGRFAAFSQELLSSVLIPYWRDERTGLVESEEIEQLSIEARRSQKGAEEPGHPMELRVGPNSAEPARVLAAEEFVAIRYMSLIGAVLANMRYLMIFVSVSFVLAIVAWNSYPFQPRQEVEWLFTGFLALLGTGMIGVFAQMHRSPILSRITDTKPNELGWDFYLRIISFGAVPVLAWLAYQFPDVGGAIYRAIQPGVSVIK